MGRDEFSLTELFSYTQGPALNVHVRCPDCQADFGSCSVGRAVGLINLYNIYIYIYKFM